LLVRFEAPAKALVFPVELSVLDGAAVVNVTDDPSAYVMVVVEEPLEFAVVWLLALAAVANISEALSLPPAWW
jgi:hypothetical protein